MIDAKEAVRFAQEKATEMFAQPSYLEEIERETDKGRDVWSITLRFAGTKPPLPSPLRSLLDRYEYKRFLIDAETGELVAMRLREVASQ